MVLMLFLSAAPLSLDAAKEVEAWRAQKDREMRASDSPLAYAGHRTLVRGLNTVGSGAADTLRFQSPGVPERALDLQVDDGGRIWLTPRAALVSLDGVPAEVDVQVPFKNADAIDVGPLHLTRAGGLQLSVADISREPMLAYRGLHYLPLDADFRVEATFEPEPSKRTVEVETSQHGTRTLPVAGVLRFSLGGRAFALEGFRLSDRPRDLFVVFKDLTSGKKTYGAGRFLWVKEPKDGKAVVDFNQAWNPLCAYSSEYNCPIPPPENRLDVAIPVGEAPYEAH